MEQTPIERLIAALNFDELGLEEQENIVEELYDLILKGTIVRVVERMDPKTLKEFNALLDTDPNLREVEAFLVERVPGAELAARETVDEITDDILLISKE